MAKLKPRPIKRVTKRATVARSKTKATKRYTPKRQGKIIMKKKKK